MNKVGLLRLATLLCIAACLTTDSVAVLGVGEHGGRGHHVHGLKSRRLLSKVILIGIMAFLRCSQRP